MPAKVPEIPATTSLDQQFARIYTPIKETLDIYEGRVGDPTVDRVVKIGELAEILTSDAIINAIIAEIGGGLNPADFLRVDGTNSMTGSLSIVTADDPKIDARDAAGDEVLFRFRNTDTGFTSTDGLEVGILSTEVARVWNYEATDLVIGTNNLTAILADSAGGLELYFAGAKKAETVTGGFSVTGDVTATGDISATQIQSVDVHTASPSDQDVLVYVAANTRYEPQAQSGGGAIFTSGLQQIRTSWVSATQFKVDKGYIDIQGTLYSLPAAITITPTLAATSNYIVYVTAPGSGTTLTATEFSISTTQPTEDLANRAWMNGNDRAICAFRTDGTPSIEWFEMTGQHYTSGDQYGAYSAVLGTGWTTVTLTREPDWVRQVEMTFRVPIFVANANVNWRPTGVTTTSIIAVSLNTSGRVPFNTIIIGVDSSLQFQVQATVGGNTVTLQSKGWIVPHSIYNG